MNELDGIKKLDDVFHCPSCEGEIEYIKDVQNPQALQKGNIVICGHCATVCKIGDSNLVKMSKQEVDLLDPQSKGMVAVLCASVAAQKIQRDAAEKGGIG